MRYFCVFGLSFFLINSAIIGQLLNQSTDSITRADSLRGSLNENRDWYDVTYYHLDLQVFPSEKRITGSNEIYFIVNRIAPIMQLDLFQNMAIDKIELLGRECPYTRELNAIFVDIPVSLKLGSIHHITVFYHGMPIEAKKAPWDGGFVWAKDENNTDWIGVACEGLGASAWWPNKDHLSDEPDSMRISCTVPSNLKFIGNGYMEKEEKVDTDFVKYTWKVSYPINNYNVTLNIGDYSHFHEMVENGGAVLDLDYYVMKSNFEKARKQFQQVKPMLKCYEKYLGPYPYPKDGFALVETPYLGMEHQGAIAYGNKYKPGYAGNTRFINGLDFDYIIIHESGHEWWGNNVSCKDIADLWIHEAFTTYTESIYVECTLDKKAALAYINSNKEGVDNKRPIIGPYGVNREGDGDMYSKGALFLNSLRNTINNDEVWWKIIRGMQDNFGGKTIDTQDVLSYFNANSGMKLDPIFDQYLRFPNIPQLMYSLVKKGKNKFDLSFRWIADNKAFNMPVEYSFDSSKPVRIFPTTNWQTIKIKKMKTENIRFSEELFYFELLAK